MHRKRLVTVLVSMMFFIFIASLAGEKWRWDIAFWWFDAVVLHFLGGIWVGLFFLWFFSADGLPWFKLKSSHLDRNLIYKTLAFVVAIGVLWEVFQFFTKNSIGREPFNALDTASDIFFDVLGGSVALFYYMKRIVLPAENKVQSS